MDLTQLAALLKQQATSSPNNYISLTDSTLGWSGSILSQLIQTQLLRSAGNILLVVDPNTIPDNPPALGFSLTAQFPTVLSDSLLNLVGNNATIAFYDIANQLQFQLIMTLTAPESGTSWSFGESFEDLEGNVYSQLQFDDPNFIFSTYQPTTGNPGDLNVDLGLNFTGEISLTGIFQPVAQLLAITGTSITDSGTDPFLLAGPITQNSLGTEFNLTVSLGIPTIDLQYFTINEPYLGNQLTRLQTTGSPVEIYNFYQLGAEIDLTNSNNDQVAVNVITLMPSILNTVPTSLSIIIAPVTPFDTSISHLGQLIAGESWNSFFSGSASVLLPYLDTFAFKNYYLNIALQQFSISSWSLTVGTLSAWTIISKKVVVDYFDVTWQSIAATQSLTIAASITLFDSYQFTGFIDLPAMNIAASFDGDITFAIGSWLNTIVNSFVPGTPIPDYVISALDSFTISNIYFAMNQPDSSMNFGTAGHWTIANTEMDFNVGISLTKVSGNYSYTLVGILNLNGPQIEGVFAKSSNQTLFSATWSDESNPLSIMDIITAFGFSPPNIPESLDLNLAEIGLVYDITNDVIVITAYSTNYGHAVFVINKVNGDYQFYFGLAVDKDINLSDLPLIGKQLEHLETIAIQQIQAIITSDVITQQQAALIDALIPAGYPTVPAAGVDQGVGVSMNFNFGGEVIPLSLGVGAPPKYNNDYPSANEQPTQTAPATGNQQVGIGLTSAANDDGITWFDIQRTFGFVTFNRIGISYQDEILWFTLDGNLSTGGLTIDLIGLSVGSPLSNFNPHFHLRGLGIDYQNGPIEIGGGFLEMPAHPPVTWEYGGAAIVKTAKFSLEAIGSYASMAGTPSLFVFAKAEGAFGGPPYFFITGFLFGFGYNRGLRIPQQNEVIDFPLIAGLTDPSRIGGHNPTPLEVLAALEGAYGNQSWITSQAGQNWIVAGIEFTTFELVNSLALLIVEFGKDFEIAIIGLATARFPQVGPVIYAYVELQITAVFKPDEGILAIAAVLSRNSYVLDPACHLTGGFAFYTWFNPSPHAGDFVLTLGGYHPNFNVPSWYPQENRLGFSWSLDSSVSINGGAYFALTPAAVMAGGSLEVLYHSGDLKAWFTAYANLIIYWQPFHFEANIGISVGASYKADLWFTSKTFSVELGADLELWGPPTGGRAHIHWWVISFTVSFGAGHSGNPDPISWPEFTDLLPLPEDAAIIQPIAGLAATQDTNSATGNTQNTDTPWIVRPDQFTFSTSSTLPAYELYLGSESGTAYSTGQPINIRPMQKENLDSFQRVSITLLNGETGEAASEIDLTNEQWQVTTLTTNVPKALWGKGQNSIHESGKDALIANQPNGFWLQAPSPTLGSSPGVINVEQDLKIIPLTPGTNPLELDLPPSGPTACLSDTTISTITDTIADTTISQQRSELFDVLNHLHINPSTNDSMSSFAQKAGIIFEDEPLLLCGTGQ